MFLSIFTNVLTVLLKIHVSNAFPMSFYANFCMDCVLFIFRQCRLSLECRGNLPFQNGLTIPVLQDIISWNKEARSRASPPAAGRFCDKILCRRMAILAERFYVIGRSFL